MKLLLAVCIAASVSSCATTDIYLVRHAEKAGADLKAPEGFARANILKDSLARKKINAVFSTNVPRTLHTAEPTAAAQLLHVMLYTDGNKLLDSLIKVKRRKFLVVGHSNTLPGMLRHAGLDPGFSGDIGDNDFDNFFLVRIRWSGGTPSKVLFRKTYGMPSP